jgi:hypothetical protein
MIRAIEYMKNQYFKLGLMTLFSICLVSFVP